MANPTTPASAPEGERVNVQRGAEIYAGLYNPPPDPWTDDVLWVRVLSAPQVVVPQSAIAGMNQAAIFLQLGLVQEGVPLLDGKTWTGIPEKPGFTLCHGTGQWVWFMVVEDDAFAEAVASGQIVHPNRPTDLPAIEPGS